MFKKIFLGLLSAFVSLQAFALNQCTEYRINTSASLDSGWQTSAEAAATIYAGKVSNPGSCAVGGPYNDATIFKAVNFNAVNNTYSYTRTTKVWNSMCTQQFDGAGSTGNWTVQTRQVECATPPPDPTTCPSQNSQFFQDLEWQFEVPSGSTLSDLDQCAPNAPGAPSGAGCTIEYNGTITQSGGKTWFSGTSSASTASCEYAPNPTGTQSPAAGYPPPPPETAKAPPAGTCPGEVNGELVYMPCSFGPSTETISVTSTRSNGTDAITDTFSGSTVCNQSTCDFSVTSTSTSASGGSTQATREGSVADTTPEGTGTEPNPCGAPGQPLCRVDIDETGVPAASTANSAFNGGQSALDAMKADAETAMNEQRTGSPLPQWTWSFALPTGCSPYPFDAFGISVNVCQFQPVIHDLMSLLWVSAGIFGLLALARSAFEGG